LGNDPAAGVAGLGAEIDDPVGLGDQVQVVLDHQDRMAGVDQAVQDADEALDVGHVQADGRLVEDVECRAIGAPAPCSGAPWRARSPA
jgi:hypothetical protein